MAIVQISKIQHRRGMQQDLPQLAAGEIGWSIDTRRAYIGNGTLIEGAPVEGRTELLTEFSALNFTADITANLAAVNGNVTILQGNVVIINGQIAALQSGSFPSTAITLISASSGLINGISASNALIAYTLSQGAKQRTGTIAMSRNGSTVSYNEEYTENSTTDISFTITANSSYGSFNYTTTSPTSLLYRISTQY